jgi:hypothetical protein
MNFIKFFENFNPILDEIFEYFSDFEDELGSDVSVYTIDRGIRVDIKTSNWPEGLSIGDFLDKFKGSLKMIESMGKFKIDQFGLEYFPFTIQVGMFQSGMDRLQVDRGMGIRQMNVPGEYPGVLSGESILRKYNNIISRGLGRRSGNTQEANLSDIYIYQISFVLNPID